MAKRNILIQLDTDPHPSVFDRVVAIDAGVEELFSYGGVTPKQIEGLVHGAMFTRGPDDLRHTAIFIGGANVAAGEQLLECVVKTFFGPLRVSVMLDANGANTTAAAAVLAAAKHLDLAGTKALVVGTGPVGQRAARLLARQGAAVRLLSRSLDRAAVAAKVINQAIAASLVEPADHPRFDSVDVLIAAGPAGAQVLSQGQREAAASLRVAIDLNAVPPLGLEGIEVMDKAKERGGQICYGAIGVGGTKMKIHRAAIARLFQSNDLILDAEAIYELGK